MHRQNTAKKKVRIFIERGMHARRTCDLECLRLGQQANKQEAFGDDSLYPRRAGIIRAISTTVQSHQATVGQLRFSFINHSLNSAKCSSTFPINFVQLRNY